MSGDRTAQWFDAQWLRMMEWLTARWRPLALFCSIAIAIIVVHSERGVELGFVLKYTVPLIITFLAANWWLAIIDLSLAIIWCVPLPWWRRFTGGTLIRQACVFGNRQFQYINGIAPWVVATSAFDWHRPLQSVPKVVLPILAGGSMFFLLLLPGVWEWLSRKLVKSSGKKPIDDDPHWRRRPVQIIGGLIGLGLVAISAPRQASELARLFLLVIVASLLRLFNWRFGMPISDWVERFHHRKETPDEQKAALDAQDEERLEQLAREAEWARRLDWLGVAIAAILVGQHFYRIAVAESRAHDTECRRLLTNACVDATKEPPKDPDDVLLFIISDSQFHEVRGVGSGSNLDLVDSIVSVAIRPIELNLLEGATLASFARRLQTLNATRPKKIRWIHLGDIADMGCQSELERFTPYIDAFGRRELAALVPGNHDSAFLGNFAWHPEWVDGCHGGELARLTKERSDDWFEREMKDDDVTRHHRVQHPNVSWLGSKRSAITTVALLGETHGKAVVAIFLDSSDYATATTLGAAGVQGTITSQQLESVRKDLAGPPFSDAAAFVIFIHHPFSALDRSSRDRLDAFIHERGKRTLAIVSSHTHLAATRSHDFDGQIIPELVVGSSMDPPQEASLLRVHNANDGLAVSLETLPAIERKDMICARHGGYGADHCRNTVAALRDHETCQPLFVDQWLEDRMSGPTHAATPAEARRRQAERAKRLIACVCRDQRSCSSLANDPIEHADLYEKLDQLTLDPKATEETLEELVCLSWAASIMQGKKREEWDFNRAMLNGFDGAATIGAIDLPGPAGRCR